MRTINPHSAFIFVQVVVSGSFTGAAKALGIPKSTVSDKVAELERELGVTLMVRTTRKLNLTDVGKEYFRKAEVAVRQLQAASEEAAQAQSRPMGVLRITAPADLTYFNLMDFVAEYRRKYPEVVVDFDFTDRMVDLVAEGFDIAIRAGHLQDSSLMAKKVGTSYLVVVASPAYLRKAPPLKQPKDLAQHKCIKFSPAPFRDVWDLHPSQGKGVKVAVPDSILTSSLAAIKTLVALGEGVSLLPLELCKQEIAEKKFVRVLPGWSTSENPVHIVYPPQRYSSPKVREAIPMLEKKVRELLD
ncbi:MAG: LysR family transcriptional regulator [Bacteriovoracia bacterium]